MKHIRNLLFYIFAPIIIWLVDWALKDQPEP